MQGRQYIHVRRKVNKEQRQRFIHIDYLSANQIEIEKKKAIQLDEEWEWEQACNDETAMSFFCSEGKLMHIIISPPQSKTDWAVKSVIHRKKEEKVFSASRSIPKYGIEEAVTQVFEKVAEFIGLKRDSLTRVVLLGLYKHALKEEFIEKHKRGEGNSRFQTQISRSDLI